MSLRFMSRVLYQGMKDQGSKFYATIKSLKDLSSSKQARRFSGGVDSSSSLKVAAKSEKLKQTEESLRTVMYLSCWGPN